jgi:hypothetical protein
MADRESLREPSKKTVAFKIIKRKFAIYWILSTLLKFVKFNRDAGVGGAIFITVMVHYVTKPVLNSLPVFPLV